MTPKVFNRRAKDVPADAVYVGRPSRWGNPYSHLPGNAEFLVGSRKEAVQSFRDYLFSNPDLMAAVKQELRGKHLVCWCAPLECHADVLLAVANDLPLTPILPRRFGF